MTRFPLEHCKIRIREVVKSLTTTIGSVRAIARYHQEGTRSFEDDYTVQEQVLGEGMNGSVQLALRCSHGAVRDKSQFAVKTFDLDRIIRDEYEDDLVSEVEIHMTVDHPHIVQLVDIYEAPCALHFVMECMHGGDLLDRLEQRTALRFGEVEAADIIHQMLLPVRYLHDLGIVHRDLKPENYLFDKDGGSNLKLADFGLSTRWKEGDANLCLAIGTLDYTAPEVLQNSYTKQCDMWSIGVISFAMLKGFLPFGDLDENQRITARKYTMSERRWSTMSPNARGFVQALLQLNHPQRLTAHEALLHPWLLEMRHEPQIPDMGFVLQGFRNFQQASRLQRVCCAMAALESSRSLAHQESHVLFTKMESLGRGVVTLEAFKQVLTKTSANICENDALLEDVFSLLDEDNDGRVQYSELLAAVGLASGQQHAVDVEDTFRRFDTNGSGFINKENLQALMNLSGDDIGMAELLEDVGLDETNRVMLQDFQICLARLTAGYDYKPEPALPCVFGQVTSVLTYA